MTDGMSLAEDVQLVLAVGNGQLRQGVMETAAAALVELVLRGRVGSVPDAGFFAGPIARKLIVIDASPTGIPSLDCALRLLVEKGKPWTAYKCVRRIWRQVSWVVQEELMGMGAVSRPGKFGSTLDHLTIVDEQQHRAAVHRLDTAWLYPENVTDPRSGAFVDLLRNAGDPFNRRQEQEQEAVIRWEWYPSELRDTIQGILEAEKLATGAGPATGWEG